ncbi:MAG: hypothetical protein H0V00_07040 [Chloroflexia bacterium]|nr:hypothetical protein [Chloroflexia bacterium]
MTGEPRTVAAATFRVWYELLEETVAHDPDETAPGNQRSALILLHDLVSIGLRNEAIRPVVIHSSGPDSFAHLMFRYMLNPEFDWSGEIALAPGPADDLARPDRLIAELAAATGIPVGES